MRWPRADLWSEEYRLIHVGTANNNSGIGGVEILITNIIGYMVNILGE